MCHIKLHILLGLALWQNRPSHCLQCQQLVWVPVYFLVDPMLIQLPANGLEKALEMTQMLGPRCLHGGPRGRKEALGPRPLPGSDLAIVATWVVNQWIENLSLAIPITL